MDLDVELAMRRSADYGKGWFPGVGLMKTEMLSGRSQETPLAV